MKYCGAIWNETFQKNYWIIVWKKKSKTALEEPTICQTAGMNFVSNGEGANYSILLGQCAPLLGVYGGLDGTG